MSATEQRRAGRTRTGSEVGLNARRVISKRYSLKDELGRPREEWPDICHRVVDAVALAETDPVRRAEFQEAMLDLMLERRFDNTLYRIGFASSRDQARQMVRHNLFSINGKKVNIPSYQVRIGDVITLKEKHQKNELIIDNLEGAVRRGLPSWLELDQSKFQGTVKALPNRDEITMPIQEQLIVELYSK